MGDKVFKIVGTLVAVAAGVGAKKVVEAGWKLVMNEDPPANPEDPETEMWQAVSWALASGVVVGVARLLASRQWTKYYTASAGRAPANPDDVS